MATRLTAPLLICLLLAAPTVAGATPTAADDDRSGDFRHDGLFIRLALGGGNPRQLRVLADGLNSLPELATLLEASEALHHWFRDQWQPLEADLRPLAVELNIALVDRPPVRRGDGDSIADGYDPTLDQARNLARHSAEAIEAFAAGQIEATGIPTLKVKQNKVFGYFIEVSNRYTDKAPEHYRRKQTIATGERYINDELDGLAEAIQAAETESDALEADLFQSLRNRAAALAGAIFQGAHLLAELDLAACFADLADRHGYVRPEILPAHEHVVELRASRHPVVERSTTEPFVANDIVLGKGGKRLIILTGPNMGGKSTLMRQVALSVLMGQAGCFVPAESARFALRDRIFTRVGASDDLSQGRSTFMVEMSETANILHHATRNSLVILDEIGRRLIPDIHERIVTKFSYAPKDFAQDLNAHLGSAFSLEPVLTQSAYFRVHNRDEHIPNLYFVGAGTHPGAGIPGVVGSAKATARLMLGGEK